MKELFPDYRARWETDDQRLLRTHAAEFFRNEATPNQERWAEQHQVDREFWNKAGAAGCYARSCRTNTVVVTVISGTRR
jgi:acyl-CoA dehydrogenase